MSVSGTSTLQWSAFTIPELDLLVSVSFSSACPAYFHHGLTMRLWSLHPNQLDSKGLVALWREGLLALAVVKGQTRGYRHHPQLLRFTRCQDPVHTLERYLLSVYDEASARGYSFDRSKLAVEPAGRSSRSRLTVAQGQVALEWQHLLRKLHHRDRARWVRQRSEAPTPHPLFRIISGPIASWERAVVA